MRQKSAGVSYNQNTAHHCTFFSESVILNSNLSCPDPFVNKVQQDTKRRGNMGDFWKACLRLTIVMAEIRVSEVTPVQVNLPELLPAVFVNKVPWERKRWMMINVWAPSPLGWSGWGTPVSSLWGCTTLPFSWVCSPWLGRGWGLRWDDTLGMAVNFVKQKWNVSDYG